MKLFRVSSKKYINDLTGTGAKIYGGRWNDKGTPLLYCSENRSLALLEILVHFDGLTVPKDLGLLHLELPDKEIENYSVSRFNKFRKMQDAEFLFKIEGEKWLHSEKSVALKVPSIITAGEFNIIINPRHNNFKKLKVKKVESLELDERLFL